VSHQRVSSSLQGTPRLGKGEGNEYKDGGIISGTRKVVNKFVEGKLHNYLGGLRAQLDDDRFIKARERGWLVGRGKKQTGSRCRLANRIKSCPNTDLCLAKAEKKGV